MGAGIGASEMRRSDSAMTDPWTQVFSSFHADQDRGDRNTSAGNAPSASRIAADMNGSSVIRVGRRRLRHAPGIGSGIRIMMVGITGARGSDLAARRRRRLPPLKGQSTAACDSNLPVPRPYLRASACICGSNSVPTRVLLRAGLALHRCQLTRAGSRAELDFPHFMRSGSQSLRIVLPSCRDNAGVGPLPGYRQIPPDQCAAWRLAITAAH
jgi:hypothetical protein